MTIKDYVFETEVKVLQTVWSQGLVVLAPGPEWLFLDLDGKEKVEVSQRLRQKFAHVQCLPIAVRTLSFPSRNGDGEHCFIKLDRAVTAVERITYQALLGSDPMRELLSRERLGHDFPHPTLFFERPDSPALEVEEIAAMRLEEGDLK